MSERTDADAQTIMALEAECERLQRENEELRGERDEMTAYRDIVNEANQQRGMANKVTEYLAKNLGDPWNPEEDELFWAAQNADTEIARLESMLDRLAKWPRSEFYGSNAEQMKEYAASHREKTDE